MQYKRSYACDNGLSCNNFILLFYVRCPGRSLCVIKKFMHFFCNKCKIAYSYAFMYVRTYIHPYIQTFPCWLFFWLMNIIRILLFYVFLFYNSGVLCGTNNACNGTNILMNYEELCLGLHRTLYLTHTIVRFFLFFFV